MNKTVELKRQVPKGPISDETKTSGEKLFLISELMTSQGNPQFLF